MSSLVVAKVDGGGNIDPAERRNGMIEAGAEINSWMMSPSENDAADFFNDIFKDVTSGGNPFGVYYFDTGGTARELTKSLPPKKNKKYNYTGAGGANLFLQVRIEEDEASESRMTIVVPRDRGDLIAAGYIPEIVNDLKTIDDDASLTDAQKKLMKEQYILATVFLTRCR